MSEIDEVRRRANSLMTEVRNFNSYVGGAGHLGANPRDRFHRENGMKRLQQIKNYLNSLEEAMEKLSST